jgi:hypothetical protein
MAEGPNDSEICSTRCTLGDVKDVISTCIHTPPCPAAEAADGEAAHTIAAHPEQGWSLLCNGIVLFDDTGELLPNGVVIAPHRPTDAHPEAFGVLVR